MPNALLEAIVYNKPALASDISSHQEIFKSEEKTNLLDPLKPELWGAKIKKLANDKEALDKIKEVCKNEKHRFSYKEMVTSFSELIKK